MQAVLEWLRGADADIARAVAALRWGPLTEVMRVLSSWWLKGPGFVIAALLVDLVRTRSRRAPQVPVVALAVLGAIAAASLIGDDLLKPLIGRVRPPDDGLGLTALVPVPSDFSFPSGHATQAFAVAVCLGCLAPRLRPAALVVAALIALSRVYLGVHFPSDVLAGALLGSLLGWAAARLATRVAPALAQPGPAASASSSAGGSAESAEPSTRMPTRRP